MTSRLRSFEVKSVLFKKAFERLDICIGQAGFPTQLRQGRPQPKLALGPHSRFQNGLYLGVRGAIMLRRPDLQRPIGFIEEIADGDGDHDGISGRLMALKST